MPGVTEEQIARAKQVDILEYMQRHESHNLVRQGPNRFVLRDHDSFVISNGMWCWNSRDYGCKTATALNYLIDVRGLGFVEAVRTLCDDVSLSYTPRPQSYTPLQEKRPFRIPPRNRNNDRVIAYLRGRGIDRELIDACIQSGALYESYESAGYHNCVFTGKNEQGKTRFACMRSISGDFRRDLDGSDKRYGFLLPPATSEGRNRLAVTEAPIDALSHQTLWKLGYYELFMEALEAISPLPLVVEPMEGMDGYCQYGEKVAIREGMGETQTVCAAVHEIGHAKLHDPTQMPDKEKSALDKKSKRTKEIEAEAVSYTVCQYYGIDTSPNSFGYIAEWSKGMELRELTASLDIIRKTAAGLIESIDAKFRELAIERGINLTEGREATETVAEQPGTPELGAPEYDEQTVQAAFDRLKSGDLLYLAGAEKPLQVTAVREADVLFVVAELAVEITQPHEQVMTALNENPKNRHLLEAADAELNPPAPLREKSEPAHQSEDAPAAPPLADNQHIETVDGVDFVITTTGSHQPEQTAPTPEKEYDLGFGHMGNGLTVWNRLEEQDGDYVTVAHIGPDRNVTYYDNSMPESVRVRIEHEARTSNLTISATQDAPVFDNPPEGEEPERPTVSGPPMPDPSISAHDRDQFGYTQPDMFPARTERALELFDQDLTVYMLSPDGTEAMAFERGEIEAHGGIFGVEASEWFECPEYRRLEAAQGEAARESMLLTGEGDAYGIYQLKDGDELHYHRWTGLDQLQAEGNEVDRANYALAYSAPLEAGVDLDDLFHLHNQDDRPAAQEMRSMSVSDVVVLRQDGNISSHYVDNSGFTELPSFLGVEQQLVQQTYSQPGNIPDQSQPAVPDGPSVAELEAQVNAGQSISLLDLAHAVNRERETSSGKGKPSILAQLQDSKRAAAQGAEAVKSAPKHDKEREV